MQNRTKYFVFGHTAKGFINFLDSNVKGINRIIILQHESNSIISQMIKRLISYYTEFDHIEVICSPKNKEYIDGIIMRQLSVAILSGEIVTQHLENAVYINLPQVENSKVNEDLMVKYKEQQNILFQEAYRLFEHGLSIHDELEKIYINEMDFEKADQVTDKMINSLFKNVRKLDKNSNIFKRLFGTNTAYGMINYVEELIDPIEHRIFIKGRAGTGKSFFMKRILEKCVEYGFDVEVYYCSFDPTSIDMLMIRDLDWCLFDSTPPHEFFPSRENDKVLDLYEKTVTAGTDDKFADEISRLTKLYKGKMRKGIEKLKETKTIEDLKEEQWKQSAVNEYNHIIQQIIQRDGKV